MATVLVYGYYGKGNVGDELMKEALRSLFEHRGVMLCFVDVLTEVDVQRSDGVIFGGGSILFNPPNIEKGALDMLLKNLRPTFYIGVGVETAIADVHLKLMSVARSIITRSNEIPDVLKNNHVVYGMPDLVYSLPTFPPNGEPATESLLIIPNVEVVPKHDSPHWMHLGWERFKDEFAQFLDIIVDGGEDPTFLLMCKNDKMDDAWAAVELIGRMKNRSSRFHIFSATADTQITSMIAKFKVVITQRYHGIVLAQMAGTPHIAIDHHDKLKNVWPQKGTNVQFHGVTKQKLVDAYNLAKQSDRQPVSVPRDVYDRLAVVISDIVTNERNARVEPVRWGA